MKWKVEQLKFKSVHHGTIWLATPMREGVIDAGGTLYKYIFPADYPAKFHLPEGPQRRRYSKAINDLRRAVKRYRDDE